MTHRRNVLLGVGAGGVFTPTLSAFTSSAIGQDAARAVRSRMTTGTGDRPQLMREPIRYVTPVPSSHSTQGWRLQVLEKSILMTRDESRRCPASDPDDHHMFVFPGCATENMAQAALLEQAGTGNLQSSSDSTKADTLGWGMTTKCLLLSSIYSCNRSSHD